MISFILRRALSTIPLLLGISFFVFCILRMGDADAAMAYIRLSGLVPTEEMLLQVRHELGLDLPLWQQYGAWLMKALQGDWGFSYVSGSSALSEVLSYMPATLSLTLWAMLLTVLGSIPLGIVGALYRDQWPDTVIRIFSFSAVSMPSYWLGFLLVLVFARQWDILPAMGNEGPLSYILPVCTLAFMSLGINARLVRAAVLEHMHSRTVMYAKARGLSSFRIWLHILRNACIPVLTALSMYFGELLGGAVIVESIFNWPGVGRYVVGAIYNHDYPVIQAFTLIMVCIFVCINFVVDCIYASIDPRIVLTTKTQTRSTRDSHAT